MNPCAACCIASHIEKLIGQAFPRQALPSVAWMLKLFWVPYFQSHSAAEFSAANTTQRQITISPAFDHYFSEISHFQGNLCPHLHKDIAPGNPFLPFPPGHPGNMWPFRQLRDTDIEQTLISSLVCTVTGLGCESFAEGASLCKGPILFETKSAFGRSWMLPNHVPCLFLLVWNSAFLRQDPAGFLLGGELNWIIWWFKIQNFKLVTLILSQASCFCRADRYLR